MRVDFVNLILTQGTKGWPVSVISPTPDIESVAEALRNGPYGRCVYDMENDVMSQQVTCFGILWITFLLVWLQIIDERTIADMRVWSIMLVP